MKSVIAAAAFLAAVLAIPSLAASSKLTVHEWGTFTSLQDDHGNVIAGVNTDDEPVPPFVHSLGAIPNTQSEMAPAFQALTTKGGIPRLHPDVTLRLETPVIYFYLPLGETRMKINVDVSFKGGWLSQYYPDATSDTRAEDVASQHLTQTTVGTLSWKNLEIGTGKAPPKTDENVWLSPRAVKAATVTAAGGESEKFLFYRGVGSAGTAEFPVTATANAGGVTLSLATDKPLPDAIPVWLVDIRGDGELAFRRAAFDGITSQCKFPAFDTTDYTLKTAGRSALMADMHDALTRAGLYPDEASAMLKTWQRSYFGAPGTRIFYLVPRLWVNSFLPLTVSTPADITRVMIGRIELVGSSQQAALQRIERGDGGATAAFIKKATTANRDWTLFMEVAAGRKPVTALGLDVPSIYRDYLALGRFRDAILLDENRRHPSPALEGFMRDSGIAMYELPPVAAPDR